LLCLLDLRSALIYAEEKLNENVFTADDLEGEIIQLKR
jgi:hypothetical protein